MNLNEFNIILHAVEQIAEQTGKPIEFVLRALVLGEIISQDEAGEMFVALT